jgi:hypothetical protein
MQTTLLCYPSVGLQRNKWPVLREDSKKACVRHSIAFDVLLWHFMQSFLESELFCPVYGTLCSTKRLMLLTNIKRFKAIEKQSYNFLLEQLAWDSSAEIKTTITEKIATAKLWLLLLIFQTIDVYIAGS